MSLDGVLSWIISGSIGGSTFILTRWVFLRALGVIYLIVFLSFWVQAKGLIGSHGILPMQEYLSAIGTKLGWWDRLTMMPTVFWWNASDVALHLVCGLGVIFAVLLIMGVAPAVNCALLWVLYLSIFHVGQDFLSFQWDTLMLEVGFLAIFFASGSGVSPLIVILFWWLLFRFMFESGIVKFTSGDLTWRNLTALQYHYFTTPLPVWVGWYLHQLPVWFHKVSVVIMFILEVGFPFLILGTRTMRMISAAGMILLQIIIMGTGNYNFFNLLSIALSVLLLDDGFWIEVLPSTFLSWIGAASGVTLAGAPVVGMGLVIVAAVLFVVGFGQIADTIGVRGVPRFVRTVESHLRPFLVINEYGLFRVMTTKRPEIIVEGSASQVLQNAEWKEYTFKWKPGALHEPPRFIEPHQPRLDWQMWFAALSRFERTPWFQQFLVRLLQGSPDVLSLLKEDPFPDHPPKYVRAVLYEYEFTNWEERKGTGNWWRRKYVGPYAPVVSLPPLPRGVRLR